MNDRAQELLRALLTRSADERTDVDKELPDGLDDSPAEDSAAVKAAWAKEIETRARRVLAGESSGQPWHLVRGRVAQRIKQR